MNDLLDWAKREVELACKKENPNRKDGEFDYGCACYESALKAFESLMQDEHSGYSIMVTKNILNRLIAHKPLTPIVDTEDVWNKTINRQEGCISYQCKRIPSLFKDVYNNGVIKYDDINRIIMTCDGKTFFHSGFIKKIAQEYINEITMPYMPSDKHYIVYCEGFLFNISNGYFDTIGVLYCMQPNGEKIEINRYFKEGEKEMIEINEDEYIIRKEN